MAVAVNCPSFVFILQLIEARSECCLLDTVLRLKQFIDIARSSLSARYVERGLYVTVRCPSSTSPVGCEQ